MPEPTVTRQQLIERPNEDLSREYQAIIAHVSYSQVLKGAQYMSLRKKLEGHATQELQRAITVSQVHRLAWRRTDRSAAARQAIDEGRGDAPRRSREREQY